MTRRNPLAATPAVDLSLPIGGFSVLYAEWGPDEEHSFLTLATR